MTKEQLAAQLTGREIGDEISKDEGKAAKSSRLLVAYGASDDLCEFDGVICDEAGAPGEISIARSGKVLEQIPEDDAEVLERYGLLDGALANRGPVIKITACWCAEKDGPSWTYQTAEPHATFDVMADGEVYCRGMVIQL